MSFEVSEIRRALECNEIVPYFQPLVDLAQGVVIGFEVLARWQHPQFGLIPPCDFIPIIEANGLADALMKAIMQSAFHAALQMPASLGISINLSSTQLQDLSLPGQVHALADAAGFPLDRLTIEITETAILKDLKMARAIIHALKSLGCKIALDDFGTGYSSLSYLQALPFDEIKIDRSFVSSMFETKENRKIVATIASLGSSLDIRIVGEGVETENQAQALLWLGCEVGQGWLFGRPIAASEVPALLASGPRNLSQVVPAMAPGLESFPTLRLPQLQAIYDGAPVGLCFLDHNFRYVSVNQRLAQMNGASIADHLGKTVRDMLPHTYADMEPYLLLAMQGLPSSDIEVEMPSAVPGAMRETRLVSYQPARDEANEVIGISVAATDITQRKQVEAALRESEEIHRNMYQLSPQVPWIMDPQGQNLEVSSQWVAATGLPPELVNNFGWISGIHPMDKSSTRKSMEEAISTGTPIDIEYRVRNAGGQWTWKRSRGAPRFGSAGEIVRWYGVVEDTPAHNS